MLRAAGCDKVPGLRRCVNDSPKTALSPEGWNSGF
jgi:hypothetical protein